MGLIVLSNINKCHRPVSGDLLNQPRLLYEIDLLILSSTCVTFDFKHLFLVPIYYFYLLEVLLRKQQQSHILPLPSFYN